MAKTELKPETPETPETTKPKFSLKELKDAILAFSNSAIETGVFDDDGGLFVTVSSVDGYKWIKDLAKQIAETSERGLPLETRLAKAQAAQAAHYATVQVVDGLPQFTTEWQAENENLTAKIYSLKAQIKRAANKAAETPA